MNQPSVENHEARKGRGDSCAKCKSYVLSLCKIIGEQKTEADQLKGELAQIKLKYEESIKIIAELAPKATGRLWKRVKSQLEESRKSKGETQ